jgi:hypothetical protein
VTTPLWVVNTRLKLQGANFHTDEHKEAKVPKYRGILGNLDNINCSKRNHLTCLISQNSLLQGKGLLEFCDNVFDIQSNLPMWSFLLRGHHFLVLL